MTLTARPLEPVDTPGEWLPRNHNRLDARLAALLIHACSGALDEAKADFEAYRSELAQHLEEAERRLLDAGSPGRDERERVLERLEWKGTVRDLRRILQAVDRELRGAHASSVYDMIAALRHAIRRHRRQETRLLQLAVLGDAFEARYRDEAQHRL